MALSILWIYDKMSYGSALWQIGGVRGTNPSDPLRGPPGPAGPFSLKTAHCAVFRALEPSLLKREA